MQKRDYIINHKRFKKRFNQYELNKYLKKKIVRFPQYSPNYYNFFNSYAKKNYKLLKNNCLCGEKNDILLSQTDRHCVDFITVVCKNCGLIRAQNYFRNIDVKDFYKNFYRTNAYAEHHHEISLANIFDKNKKDSRFRYDLLNKYKIRSINNLKIVDVGGGIGAILDHFDNSNEKYLVDYYDPYLNYAKKKGIKIIKGGLNKINFKPDIIILSHVIEHWNNFEYEIQKLISIQKKNQTLNYIEFPGVDSIKKGRREGDILGDIHVPHVYYFTSYVFENLMNRYGFKKIYLDTLIKSIFIYTGEKKSLINYFELCQNDLISAEKTRKLQIFKNFIKLFIPTFFLKLIR
jgi:hypothetical protein